VVALAIFFQMGGGVGDLLPDDGRQGVEAELLPLDEQVGVQRLDDVPAVASARAAHVADHDAHPAAGDEHVQALRPHGVELVEELAAVVDMAELRVLPVAGILFEVPVGGRGDDEVDLGVGQRLAHHSGVAQIEIVGGGHGAAASLPRLLLGEELLAERGFPGASRPGARALADQREAARITVRLAPVAAHVCCSGLPLVCE